MSNQSKYALSEKNMAIAKEIFPEGKLSSADMKKVPLFYAKAKGSKVYDIDGNEYIDYFLGNGPLILGHCHDEVVSAIKEQAEKGINFGGHSEISLKFAQKICDSVKSIERMRYTSTGTEATYYAIRIARAYTKRDYILRFEGAYHGHHNLALMSSKMKHASIDLLKKYPIPDTRPYVDSAGIPNDEADKVFIAPFNNIERLEEILEKHGDKIACVMVEPVQRYIEPKDDFLKKVRELTKKYGILMFFDEIVTGFRLAPGGAQQYYGVDADITALGKITGGGFPHGVIGGPKEIMDKVFDPTSDQYVFHAGTFSGNAIACAAGYTQVSVLERDDLYERLHYLGKKIREGIREVLNKTGLPYRVYGVGPMWHFSFIDKDIIDYRSSLFANKSLADKIVTKMYDKGVLCSLGRNYISAVHSDEDIDKTIEIFEESVKETLREEKKNV